MKVALVHYWLVGMRGGEAVIEALSDMFPQADIFTHVCLPERISERIKRHRIRTTFIARLPFASKLYKKYLPLMPLALEHYVSKLSPTNPCRPTANFLNRKVKRH